VKIVAKQATLDDWIRLAYEGCPPPEAYLREELAALEPSARERLEHHAASCAACAAERELTMAFDAPEGFAPASEREVEKIARQLKRHAPHARRSGRFGGVSWGSLLRMPAFQLAATAVLLVGVGLGIRSATPPQLTGDPNAVVTRSSSLELVRPVGDVEAVPSELAWQAVDGAASYRITVRGVDEAELWTATTETTVVAVDERLADVLRPAVAYLWTVEALDAAGARIAWSAPARFRIDPVRVGEGG
jgi:hypothetical protein